MQKLRYIFGLLVIVLVAFQAFAADDKPDQVFSDGEILVKIKTDVDANEFLSKNQETGAKIVKDFFATGWQLVRLPENLTVTDAVAQYQSLNSVEFAQPNYIYHVALAPNDPSYGSLYGMTKINAPKAWDTSTGSANVVVAVVDTGARLTHEDLAANIWRNPAEIQGNGVDDDGNGYIDDFNGYDFINNDSDPSDDYNHGVHVSGTIGAVGNNTKGVTGVNWNVRLMILKIHDATGNSTSAKIVEAYQYIRTMKLRGINIKVTNNSYGGCNEACGFDQATKDAIDAVGNVDILNVFAAGNDAANNDATPFYPANYTSPSIISVAASDSNDNRSSFSSYGATTVDIAAPGSGILSTLRASDTSYGTFSGTSMATPHVAGAAALVASVFPSISAQAIKTRLMDSVDKLPQWSVIVASGGRLNVAKAIQNRPVLDFDGDGRTDFSALQNVNNAIVWHNLRSTDRYSATTFGLFNGDQAVPADFDGDGKTDVAVWRSGNQGTFYAINSQNNTVQIVNWGTSGDNPTLTQDFDGDRKADFAVTRGANGKLTWYILLSSGGFRAIQFGAEGDKPIRGDFDGDGKADIAVYRPSNLSPANTFFILRSSDSNVTVQSFGVSVTDKPIPADFDGDGKTDIAVFRTTNGTWYWLESGNTNNFRAVQFGLGTDLPCVGDYDGDGKTDIAVWRANSLPTEAGIFYVNQSANGVSVFSWGNNLMKIPAATLQAGY